MEISTNDESEFRLLIECRIRYLSVAAGTLAIGTLRFLPDLLEALSTPLLSPKYKTVAYIARVPNTSELKVVFSEEKLAGVQNWWHPPIIDCLRLKRVNQVTHRSSKLLSRRRIHHCLQYSWPKSPGGSGKSHESSGRLKLTVFWKELC